MSLWPKKSKADTGCPGCAGRLFSVISTIQRVRHGGSSVAAETVGARVSCQTCGMIFSVGPDGPFHHHPASWPFMPQQAVVQRPEPTPGAGKVFPMPDSRPKPNFPKSGA